MKKKFFQRRGRRMLFLPVFLAALASCVGVSADIQMRRDGSGTIALEYRYSRMAETIGRLDGNEKWQIIPLGRADWERTIARLPGMKLASFSAREKENDIVNNVTLEFKNTEALLAFLDSSGKRASFAGGNRLDITLLEAPSSAIDPGLLDLMKQVSQGYRFKISFSAEGNSALALSNAAGGAFVPPADAQIITAGKKVSLDIGTGGLLSLKEGLILSFTW
ncbi:MAG: hypothetical protein LBU82_05865 [Treponema sp.]|jgi:hypothetical protein|nr:hypothetical protein [Treponema sp.]